MFFALRDASVGFLLQSIPSTSAFGFPPWRPWSSWPASRSCMRLLPWTHRGLGHRPPAWAVKVSVVPGASAALGSAGNRVPGLHRLPRSSQPFLLQIRLSKWHSHLPAGHRAKSKGVVLTFLSVTHLLNPQTVSPALFSELWGQ